MTANLRFTLNGVPTTAVAKPGQRLSDLLREEMGQRDVKVGCDAGDCGACSVLLNGNVVCACLTPAQRINGSEVETSTTASERLKASFHHHGAAQCGICTPGMLVTATALLSANPEPTRGEIEDALGGVLCRCTGYSKIVDAIFDNRTTAPSKLPAIGAAVGSRMERVDGKPKINGTECFGADAWPAGALWVRAVRSPSFATKFSFGNIRAWQGAHPGIEAIFTAADIPGANRFGVIPGMEDQPALAEGETRFKGEAIAIIAGDRDVLDNLDLSNFPVSWVPLSPTLNPAEALVNGARQLHPKRPGNILVQGRVAQGNSKSGLAQATHVIEAEIETSFVEHAYIEPEAGSAWMDGDTLVIQACTQAPVMDQESVATILNLQKDKVRIIPTAAGGGFGSKLDISLQPFIGLVALKTGRPARMVYERSESMAATTKRHPALMRARIGIHSNGEISGMEFEGDFNTGPYASWGPTVANRVPVHASGPYRTPNYLATTRAILTNGPVAGAFRGFGVPQAAIIQETIYDKLAETVGMDRLDFRIMNALRDGDRTVCGQELQGVGIVDCLEALKPSWAVSLAEAKTFNVETGHIRRGVGVASCWYGCGNTSLSNPSTVRIGVTHEGRVVLHQGATDIGQGANTVMTQIASDALGLPIESFDLIGPDTALTPDCGKTSASRQTVVTGKATLLAAQALRKDILRRANMGDNATLTLDAGRIVVADGTHRQQIVLQSLSPDARGYAISAEETYDPPTLPLDKNGQGSPYAVYGYGAQLAVVDVDTALGTVKVRRIIAAHDLGHVINPLLAEGQIEGGIAQGLGMALMEEFIPGRTENLHDYLIPTTGDMPTIETILIETPDPEGPLGAKGLGEHVLIPTAPAILNAIRHATGAEISKVPALPHRLLAAIKAKEAVQ